MSAIIKVENLGKKYTIRHEHSERYTALRDVVTNKAKKLFSFPKKLRPLSSNVDYEDFWALKDLNFEIQQGDRVGIIGRNGAGKSTLLKLLSRITEPSIGRVELNGRVASLLEVGTGFHPELTGRENIFLNGTILGMGRNEIRNKFEEIVDFAGIENFLDTPVKRYSSGMYVRLAFAVAAHLDPEILVIDEVLSVGDAQFQTKAIGKMHEVNSKEGRTLLFVSHHMGTILNLCNKGMLFDKGKLLELGSSNSIVNKYIKNNSTYTTNFEIYKHIKNVILKDEHFNIIDTLPFNNKLNLNIELNCLNLQDNGIILGIALLDRNKNRVFTDYRYINEFHVTKKDQNVNLMINIDSSIVAPGHYSFTIAILNYSSGEIIEITEDVLPFTIIDSGTRMAKFEGEMYGSIILNNKWNVYEVD